VLRLAGSEFIARFLLHVLPSGFKRIRHYGLLSPARKKVGTGCRPLGALPCRPPQAAVIESVAAVPVPGGPPFEYDVLSALRHRTVFGSLPRCCRSIGKMHEGLPETGIKRLTPSFL
jgi:hypothetical protein